MREVPEATNAVQDALDVLLVEDNEDDVAIAERALAKSGMPMVLRVARDGEEALHLLIHEGADTRLDRSWVPDLVVLDLNLPKVDGLDVLRRLKARRDLAALPVVVLSGSGNDRQVRECMELGTNLYLLKPMNMAGVMNILIGIQRYWATIDRTAQEAGGSHD